MTPIAPSSQPPRGWVSVWEPMRRAGPGLRERPNTVPIPVDAGVEARFLQARAKPVARLDVDRAQ